MHRDNSSHLVTRKSGRTSCLCPEVSPPYKSPLRAVHSCCANVENLVENCGGELVVGESPWWWYDHNHTNPFLRFLIARFIWWQEPPLQQLEFKNLPVDSSGQYKIQRNFLLSKIRQDRDQHDVILVTHCTSNHLHYILDLSVHWKGPISLGTKMDNSLLLLKIKALGK